MDRQQKTHTKKNDEIKFVSACVCDVKFTHERICLLHLKQTTNNIQQQQHRQQTQQIFLKNEKFFSLIITTTTTKAGQIFRRRYPIYFHWSIPELASVIIFLSYHFPALSMLLPLLLLLFMLLNLFFTIVAECAQSCHCIEIAMWDITCLPIQRIVSVRKSISD